MQYDFRSLLDEKEEIVTERDAYKCKVHRLNYELNVMLNGGQTQKTVLDLDAIVLENKYLHDRLQNLEQELDIAKQSATKYKVIFCDIYIGNDFLCYFLTWLWCFLLKICLGNVSSLCLKPKEKK